MASARERMRKVARRIGILPLVLLATTLVPPAMVAGAESQDPLPASAEIGPAPPYTLDFTVRVLLDLEHPPLDEVEAREITCSGPAGCVPIKLGRLDLWSVDVTDVVSIPAEDEQVSALQLERCVAAAAEETWFDRVVAGGRVAGGVSTAAGGGVTGWLLSQLGVPVPVRVAIGLGMAADAAAAHLSTTPCEMSVAAVVAYQRALEKFAAGDYTITACLQASLDGNQLRGCGSGALSTLIGRQILQPDAGLIAGLVQRVRSVFTSTMVPVAVELCVVSGPAIDDGQALAGIPPCESADASADVPRVFQGRGVFGLTYIESEAAQCSIAEPVGSRLVLEPDGTAVLWLADSPQTRGSAEVDEAGNITPIIECFMQGRERYYSGHWAADGSSVVATILFGQDAAPIAFTIDSLNATAHAEIGLADGVRSYIFDLTLPEAP